jgi:predicted nucleic acid-binding protein
VVLDSWAWWEVLHDSRAGKRIARRCLESPGVHVLIVDLAMAEISAKLACVGRVDLIPGSVQTMGELGETLPISRDVAEATGPLLLRLRRRDSQASLADAVMLAAARSAGARLVSNDSCYRGEADVVRS